MITGDELAHEWGGLRAAVPLVRRETVIRIITQADRSATSTKHGFDPAALILTKHCHTTTTGSIDHFVTV
jgi:hypothetical protein